MALSITLSLTACLLLPQDKPAAENVQTVLAKGDLDTLRNRVREYFTARDATYDAPESRKEAARKKEEQAREKLKKEWAARVGSKEQAVLASLADLRAIFTGCFEFERQSGNGEVRPMKPKKMPAYDLVLPKKYRPDTPIPTVLLMRGHTGEKWVSASEWYVSTWKGAAEAGDFAFVMPGVDDSIDFDPPANLAEAGGQATDAARRMTTLGSLGAASSAIHVDRDRIYLDCGKGTCAWGLRLATYFPHLFAGIVLRHPAEVTDLRLDSLAGVPFLLLRTDETRAACDQLAEQLNKLKDGTATLLDAKGAYPHAESAPEIAAWLKGRVRDLMRPHVVVANNHDQCLRAFWVYMGTAEPIAQTPPDLQPRLEVVADKTTNKLTITARGVNDFMVRLNDQLVDLDKEIVAVINGKAEAPFKLHRSFNDLLELVYRGSGRDPGM
ncbi:MAG TPA: hypothetical protein VK081_07665, partial [Planctomycetota bacterium]|nr:hypothetical protein [Planctomycetota bacterium]